MRSQKLNLKKIFLTLPTLAMALFAIHSVTHVNRSTAAIAPLSATETFKNWGIFNSNESHIHALDAWKIEKGSKSVVVAVIDTGIDPNHKDLSDNIWQSPKNRALNSLSIDPLTYARKKINKNSLKSKNKKHEAVFGWDFVTNKANPMDDHGHGTHVAGIIGAVSNKTSGVSGVAQKVSIMAVKYYSEGNSGALNLANTIKALNYAIDNGAKIINYSGGGPQRSDEEYIALKRAEKNGILVVAAAGNERQNADIESNFYYPAAYGLKNIISVAATNQKNELIRSSNWGVKHVDVAAPGENIYSTLPGNRYGYMTGTSQATAFVSGVAALLLSRNPHLTPEEIISVIKKSVDPMPQLVGKVAASGRVNAYKALLTLKEKKKTPEFYSPGVLAGKDQKETPAKRKIAAPKQSSL